jgi:hypothetical protein
MALYTTLHLHNVVPGRESDYAAWFDGPHREAVQRQRGYIAADRFEVAREQIMPHIPQPWRFMSVYQFDYPAPEIDLFGLGPLLAEARDAGMVEVASDSERIWSYANYHGWVAGPNWRRDLPFSGVFFIPGNYTIGREAEYHRWYEEVHINDMVACPGIVAMARGKLAPLQIEPRRHCPGSEMILCAQQTDNLAFTIRESILRGQGESPSGVTMGPRTDAGSPALTVHWFTKVSGPDYWPGGVAYAGDRSPYPELSA